MPPFFQRGAELHEERHANSASTCCAAATALSAVTFVAPTPAQAWGYRANGYRYAPYAYAHAYRP